MKFESFTGGSYESRSRIADGEKTVNLFPELIESGQGKNRVCLYGSPGLQHFATLPDGPIRGIWSSHQSAVDPSTGGQDRVFVVAGAHLYEVFSDGTNSEIGVVQNATTTADITSNGAQLFVVSGGKAYIATGVSLVEVNDASTGCYLDTYFIISKPFDNQFYISNINNGLIWDPADFSTKGGYPDHIVRVFSDHRLLWLFGTDTIEVWYDTGAALFPFSPIQGGYIEHGLAASSSVAKVGETLMWLGADERGSGVVYYAQGFVPSRVSTHAVENTIQNLVDQGIRIDDAVGISFQDRGHVMYQLTFPSAELTLVYDQNTQLWHNRAAWVTQTATWKKHKASCFSYAFGKHLCGSFEDGTIYEQSVEFKDDAGSVIRRIRRAPHLCNEETNIRYGSFQLDLQKGVVPEGGPGSDPIFILRYSDDGGFTWSNDKIARPGKVGKYKHRCMWRQLGSGRDRVFEVESSEPIEHAWVNAYINLQQSNELQPQGASK